MAKKTSIAEKISSQLKEKQKVNEARSFIPESGPDALPIIKELMKTNFSKGKRMQREACKKMLHLANSNEAISNTFMRGIDKAATKIGEAIMKKMNEKSCMKKKEK